MRDLVDDVRTEFESQNDSALYIPTPDWIELTEKTFVFACYAHSAFLNGDLQTKREILIALGQNFLLKDQKLVITPNDWLKPIVEKYPALEKKVSVG